MSTEIPNNAQTTRELWGGSVKTRQLKRRSSIKSTGKTSVGNPIKHNVNAIRPAVAVGEPQDPTERHTESLAQQTGQRVKANDAKAPRAGGGAADASIRASDAARPFPAPAALGQSLRIWQTSLQPWQARRSTHVADWSP